ncbi:MAG: 1,4-dihydroxy-6-naphthoate synthase [Desulfovibrio sp.]|nr:1,4-dihydroxy-6-naphthoate synthase [Desulfovibrio sp.]
MGALRHGPAAQARQNLFLLEVETVPSVTDPFTLGLSPCPNDTFIFHALLHGLVPFERAISPHMADVEELNSLAGQGALMATKMSLGAAASIMERYALLSSGAALGFGCGPLVVAKRRIPEPEWKNARVAVPGRLTTANLLLSLHGGFAEERKEMLFSDIMPSVARGDVEIGVIIHEGRFTYEEYGLVRLLDLGEWWENTYRLPLPLGAIAVRRDIPRETAFALQTAIAESLRYARRTPGASRDFIRAHAQELADTVVDAHIKTFVTDYSLDLGEAGRDAITKLVERSAGMSGRRIPAAGLFLQ